MIPPDKRKAIFLLHEEGMGLRELARNMHISTTTVMNIIAQEGKMPQTARKDKIEVDSALLAKLYETCQGRAQRVYEKLTEEEGIDVAYSTLTRMLREEGLSHHRHPAGANRFRTNPGVRCSMTRRLIVFAWVKKQCWSKGAFCTFGIVKSVT